MKLHNLHIMFISLFSSRAINAFQVRSSRYGQVHKVFKTTIVKATPISPDGAFETLGLVPELVESLHSQGISVPTPVQKAVIPRILSGENIVMAASTGSGKTLAYVLPTLQHIKAQEVIGYDRSIKRPRCLILTPTRELAEQVLVNVKKLSYYCKVSSRALYGGVEIGKQKKSLEDFVDVVVGSPERIIQHKDKGNLYMSKVTHVIIDEVDTMLTQGFGSDIRAILRSVLNRPPSHNETAPTSAQVIMATATLTKAVRLLLNDMDGSFNIEFNDPNNPTPRRPQLTDKKVAIKIVEVDGLHRILPHVRHDVEDTKGVDKILILNDVIKRYESRKYRTMIFCNTVSSARAVDHALTEGGMIVQSYHGDLNSDERFQGLERFRSGERQYLVCTDIAARGIDIPEVDHVIMFDFPMNPIDYLHRAGRCGRAGRKGLVTALVTKRDRVLSDAIQGCIMRGLPIDGLTSSKRDYQDKGKLAAVVGRRTREEASLKAKREAKINEGLNTRLIKSYPKSTGPKTTPNTETKTPVRKEMKKEGPVRSAMDARIRATQQTSEESSSRPPSSSSSSSTTRTATRSRSSPGTGAKVFTRRAGGGSGASSTSSDSSRSTSRSSPGTSASRSSSTSGSSGGGGGRPRSTSGGSSGSSRRSTASADRSGSSSGPRKSSTVPRKKSTSRG